MVSPQKMTDGSNLTNLTMVQLPPSVKTLLVCLIKSLLQRAYVCNVNYINDKLVAIIPVVLRKYFVEVTRLISRSFYLHMQ